MPSSSSSFLILEFGTKVLAIQLAGKGSYPVIWPPFHFLLMTLLEPYFSLPHLSYSIIGTVKVVGHS